MRPDPVIPRLHLTPDYSISRIIKGGWHLAGGHGAVDAQSAVEDMVRFVEAGITTFDCADIYTGVESLIGDFRRDHPSLAREVQVHTKFVPDLSSLATLTRRDVEAGIDRSLRRLGLERLDVVQFHWWDYAVPRYVEIALELDRLRHAGKIRHVSLTNFDAARLSEILAAGVPVLTHQLQYSLIDDRPRRAMAQLCAARGISLLCYGSVAGGFLSDRWLDTPEPSDLTNRSLIKYKLIIDDFGGWDLFQALLRGLADIAAKHRTDIASVAARAVLANPAVAAVIIGAVNANHLAAHRAIFDFALDAEDLAALGRIDQRRSGPKGDVYDLERDREGPHGRIMKYELNQ
jgi:aryl-alcohol dehydrogenase-like predicted oxidoreductase